MVIYTHLDSYFDENSSKKWSRGVDKVLAQSFFGQLKSPTNEQKLSEARVTSSNKATRESSFEGVLDGDLYKQPTKIDL